MSYVTDWAEEFSDAEDDWPIGNPEVSWKEAERMTTSYSRTRGGTYAQSRYYYRQKDKQAAQDQERIRKEHKTLEFSEASSQPHTPATIRAKSDPQEFGAESAVLVLKEALAKDISEFDVWADEKLKNAGKIWATRIKLARSLLKLEQKKPEFSSLPDSLTLAYSVEKGLNMHDSFNVGLETGRYTGWVFRNQKLTTTPVDTPVSKTKKSLLLYESI